MLPLSQAMAPVAHAADPDEQKSMFDKVNEERIRQHILRVEHHLENKESNFLVGDAVSNSYKLSRSSVTFLTVPVDHLGGFGVLFVLQISRHG